MRKTSDKPRHSTGHLANTPQEDCQAHEKQGKTKKLSPSKGNDGDMQ